MNNNKIVIKNQIELIVVFVIRLYSCRTVGCEVEDRPIEINNSQIKYYCNIEMFLIIPSIEWLINRSPDIMVEPTDDSF